NGTEFKLGAASDIGDENVSDGVYAADDIAEMFIQNETAYWTLYIVDGYCYEAVKTDKVQKTDLYVTSKSVVYNTSDNKVTYIFALNTKADGKGDAYTFTATTDGYNANYDKIDIGDLVAYTYDANTKEAYGITEYFAIAEEDATEDMTVETGSVAVEIPKEVVNVLPEETTSITLVHTTPEVDAAAGTVTFDSVELIDQNGEVVDLETLNTTGEKLTVTLPVSGIANGTNVVIYHDGVAVATAVVTDGKVTYEADHFCEVVIAAASATVKNADELVAAIAEGGRIVLAADITIASKLTITKDTEIIGDGKTLTYTGDDRVIDVVKESVDVDLIIRDLTVDCTAGYTARGINLNNNGKHELHNVVVEGENITYAINMPDSSDNSTLLINGGSYTANIALNVWGEDVVITAKDADFISVDNNTVEEYKAIGLNNNGGESVAEGTVITVEGGSIIARDENGDPSTAISNATLTGEVNVCEDVEVVGAIRTPVAVVLYEGQDNFYSCFTLEEAIDTAQKTPAATTTVKLLQDIELEKKLVIDGSVVIDLNGKIISYTNTEAAASCAIENKGNLTLMNGTVTYQGVGDPSFGYGTNTINNTGKLVIENATIINTTTVGSSVGVDCSAGAELIVNSGEIKSEKNAIRLCPFGSAAISCTINGGTITGARAIQIQLPSNNPASAPEINLTVNGGTLTSKVADGLALYSYSAGQSFANVDVTIAGGTFNGHVAFGGGYKGDAETVTVTGGTFNGDLGRYLVGDGWEDITIS
ncbi:MAG: hypothetical protein IJD13_07940, partial [Oscillospiraceae bacterium]|nr:hypothetical protein [Oscillospiraceae bacterium]